MNRNYPSEHKGNIFFIPVKKGKTYDMKEQTQCEAVLRARGSWAVLRADGPGLRRVVRKGKCKSPRRHVVPSCGCSTLRPYKKLGNSGLELMAHRPITLRNNVGAAVGTLSSFASYSFLSHLGRAISTLLMLLGRLEILVCCLSSSLRVGNRGELNGRCSLSRTISFRVYFLEEK